MALDSENVLVAYTGAVYVGPTTATAPTASDSTTTGFTDLGFINSDGVKESINKTVQSIKAWQNGATVRTVVSEAEYSIQFTLIETKLEVLELYYGVDVTAGVIDGNPSATGGRKSFIIDAIDGLNIERTYIPAGEVTAVGERVLASSEPLGYEITITAYADSSGVTFQKFISSLEI